MTDEQNLADKIEWLDAVEVTQADEHAAEEAWRSIKAFLEGSAEDPGLVDAFARHRLAALRLAEQPGDAAGLVERLEAGAEQADNLRSNTELSVAERMVHGAWAITARQAAAALTALSRRIAELEGLVRRAAINLSETAYPSWHEDARAALKEEGNG